MPASPAIGCANYAPRRELAEQISHLQWATNDTAWICAAENILLPTQFSTSVLCGHTNIQNDAALQHENLMA